MKSTRRFGAASFPAESRVANRPTCARRHVSIIFVCLFAAIVTAQGQVTFSSPVSYSVGANPQNILVGDFNGDGIPDLAVTNKGDSAAGDLGSVSVLVGNGDGTFQPALNTPVELFQSSYYKNLYSGDFNGDGKLDLLVLGAEDPTTGQLPWSVLMGNGNGTFSAPIQVNSTYPVISLAVGDFNGDKKLDVVFVNDFPMEMLGNGDGTFQPAQLVSDKVGGIVVSGDFNGDGKLDLAVGGTGSPDSYQVLLGNGDGTFGPPSVTSLAGTLFPVDLNHDGRTDFIMHREEVFNCQALLFLGRRIKFSIQSMIARADGTFQPKQEIANSVVDHCQGTGYGIGAGGLGDYDGDGNVDLIVIGSPTGAQFYAGLGNGAFRSNPVLISGVPGSPTEDLNEDKLADGVEVLTSSAIGVVLNTTQGFWLDAPASFGPLHAGGSATGTISVNPQNGFSNAVSLTCSTPQFAGIICSLSPSTVAPGSNSTLTVSTTGNSATFSSPGTHVHLAWLALCLPLCGLALGGFGVGSRQNAQRILAVITLGCLLFICAISLVACGSAGSKASKVGGGTSSGTYTITVTGTAGTTTRTSAVRLTVQ